MYEPITQNISPTE